jgi:hypothetical protein
MLPEAPLPPPQPAQINTEARASEPNASLDRLPAHMPNPINIPRAQNMPTIINNTCGAVRPAGGFSMLDPVVPTMIDVEIVDVPDNLTEAGITLQINPELAPGQVREKLIVPSKPSIPPMVTVAAPEFPGLEIVIVGFGFVVKAKSGYLNSITLEELV